MIATGKFQKRKLKAQQNKTARVSPLMCSVSRKMAKFKLPLLSNIPFQLRLF